MEAIHQLDRPLAIVMRLRRLDVREIFQTDALGQVVGVLKGDDQVVWGVFTDASDHFILEQQ